MTESSGDRKIEGFLPISEQDKMQELKRLVSVLRYNLAIVYDCRMGTGRPEEIQTLLERIGSELHISLRILIDGEEVTFFVPLDAEDSDFFPGALTSGWFRTINATEAEALHGLSPEERKRLKELDDLLDDAQRGPFDRPKRGSYTCKPDEHPDRIEDLVRRVASMVEDRHLWTWIEGREVRFQHVDSEDEEAMHEDLGQRERQLFMELYDLVVTNPEASYRCKPGETPERIEELLRRIEGTESFRDITDGESLGIRSTGQDVFFEVRDDDEEDGPLDGGRLVAIDDRYVVRGDAPDIQMRLAVSYGPNTTKASAGAILAPPSQEGDFVFGLHHIGIKGSRLAILDSWMDSSDARGVTSEAAILSRAKDILASLSDEDYRKLLEEFPEDVRQEFRRSPFAGPWEEVIDEEL